MADEKCEKCEKKSKDENYYIHFLCSSEKYKICKKESLDNETLKLVDFIKKQIRKSTKFLIEVESHGEVDWYTELDKIYLNSVEITNVLYDFKSYEKYKSNIMDKISEVE